MAYPLSTAVSAGDATLASHYNNARSDALYLGQAPADAVALGSALDRLEFRLTLERLNTTQVRVPASATAPVSLLIYGFLVQAIANVDLAIGNAPSGAAAAFYVFAERAAGSTTFTLSVSTSPTELANKRKIGRFYWDGAKIVKDSVRTELSEHIAKLIYFVDPQVCHGRLTASTGVPVPTGDVASSAFVFFTAHIGNRVALYVNDYGWRIYPFGELSISVAAYASGKNLDIFIYDNAGTLTLSAEEWSNDTLRATAISRQDGVWVKTGAPEYRYLGTVRTSGAGVTCDTRLKRFIWNFYNRIERELFFKETADSWTYAVSAWRQLNANAANKVEFVIGVNETIVYFETQCLGENSANNVISVNIGLDRTDNQDGMIIRGSYLVATGNNIAWYGANFRGLVGIGYHYLAAVEYHSGGTNTMYGDRTAPHALQSGGIGYIDM